VADDEDDEEEEGEREEVFMMMGEWGEEVWVVVRRKMSMAIDALSKTVSRGGR
jgi:hypothetical protein